MDYKERYNEWLLFDDDTKQELLKITDEKEIEDRFYKDLAFGTGGMRGIMGAGPNRMNRYTISRATLGLANYLSDFPTPQKRGNCLRFPQQFRRFCKMCGGSPCRKRHYRLSV